MLLLIIINTNLKANRMFFILSTSSLIVCCIKTTSLEILSNYLMHKDKQAIIINFSVIKINIGRGSFPDKERFKRWVTYRFSYAMCRNDANKMTPHPFNLRHSPNFDIIDSFLMPNLDLCILGNLIVGWGRWVIKEGSGFLHQIFRFSVEVLMFGVGFIKARAGIF